MDYKTIKYKNISDIYLISEYGDIYSKYYRRKLKASKDKDGYLKISLNTKDGKRKSFRIATLVTSTFIGKCPFDMKDPTVNHIDGNILNNHYTNLEWMERAENSRKRIHIAKGSLNGTAILNEDDVEKICELLISSNMSFDEIGILFNVEKSTVSNIKRGRNWKSISKKYPLLKKCRIKHRNKINGRIESFNPLLERVV